MHFPALFLILYILFIHTGTTYRSLDLTFFKVAFETRPTRAGSDRSRAGGYRTESDDDDDDDVGDVVL